MERMVGCQIKCNCGGTVTHLVDGVMYFLTSKQTILFGGVCDTCGKIVKVERLIQSLFFECPEKGNGRVQ